MVTLANFLSLPSLKMICLHAIVLKLKGSCYPVPIEGMGPIRCHVIFCCIFLDGGCSAPPVMLSDDLRCYVDIGLYSLFTVESWCQLKDFIVSLPFHGLCVSSVRHLGCLNARYRLGMLGTPVLSKTTVSAALHFTAYLIYLGSFLEAKSLFHANL